MLAVDRVNLSGFCVVLKVCVILWNVSRLGYVQGDIVKPQVTISLKSIKLMSLNASTSQPATVGCAVRPNKDISQIAYLKIFRTLDNGLSTDEEILVSTAGQSSPRLGDPIKNQLNKFKANGKLFPGGGQTGSAISILIKITTCEDAGIYKCSMEYDSADGSTKLGSGESRLPMEPLDFKVFRTPADAKILPGLKLKLTCSAVIGTVEFTEKTRLVWVYRNRDSSIAGQYNPLEKELAKNMTEKVDKKVKCSEKHTVTLDLVVDKVRENKRDYFCAVRRIEQVGGAIVHVTRSDGNNIPGFIFPTFEEPKVAAIGIGGFVGIGLACFAFLVGTAFGVVWCKRRSKKKEDRKNEVELRKSNIELRRKEIASIVTGKRSSTGAANDPESAAEGESVAEESNNE